MKRFCASIAFIAVLCLLPTYVSTAYGQLPSSQLEAIFPSGAALRSSLDVTIYGKDLDDSEKLVFSHAGIQAVRKMADPTPFDEGPQPVENVFTVTVGDNVPAGTYEVRSHGRFGLSNPRSFVVTTLPQISEVEPNGVNELPAWTEVDDGMGGKKQANVATEFSLPASLVGQSTGGADVDWYRFTGTSGNRVMLDGLAKRIDSPMEMNIILFKADGSVVGEGRKGSHGDPVIDATLPVNGEYFIKVFDSLYRNGNAFFYRLNVGPLPHLDFVFPPVGQPGSNDEYTVYGSNLPGGSKSSLTIDGNPVESLKVRIAIPGDVTDKLQYSSPLGPHQSSVDGIEYRLNAGNVLSNPVLVTAATAPVILEQADNDRPETAQKLTVPCEVAGQFYPRRDVDWYSFEAKKGETWAIDLVSQRLGVATDPTLLIQRISTTEAGEQQITEIQFVDDVQEVNVNNKWGRHEFDVSSTDPSYVFTPPAEGTYRVLVKDGLSSVKSDPRLVYRLAIRQPAHDFRVVAVPNNSPGGMLLRRGGREVVHVFASRRDGFNGEIHVSCTGLPAGVTTEAITIGPANTKGTIVLTTADNAPAGVSSLSITAKGVVAGKEVVRSARYGAALEATTLAQPTANTPSVPARLVNGIQVCVTDYDPTPMMLTIGEGKPIETSRGGVVKIPYQVKKLETAKGNLSGFLMDFPPQTTVPQVNIGGNAKGEFELRFQAATPPGTYTVFLAGFNQGHSYQRHPELAERATKRQERVAKVLADAQQKVADLQKDATQKQTELQAATAALADAKTKLTQAEQATASADAAVKATETALKQRQTAAAANAEDASLKTQVADAQKAHETALKKLDEAKALLVTAQKIMEAATVNMGELQAAKTLADQTLQAARDFQTLAQQEKQRADQFATLKKNEANPKNINFIVPSNSLTITIAEYPLKVESMPAEVTVKQGEKIEVPVKITRLYDFKAAVSIQTQLPSGVSGIAPKNINVAENQTDAKFEINAQTNASVGEHACAVRLQMSFNGQNLTLERPLKLTVVEVKPPG